MKKSIEKFNTILKNRFQKKFGLMRSVRVGQAGNAFREVSSEIKAMEGSRMVWFKQGSLRIKVNSASQKQELLLEKSRIKRELEKKGIEVLKIEVTY